MILKATIYFATIVYVVAQNCIPKDQLTPVLMSSSGLVSTPSKSVIGRPGKMGPKGQKGEIGQSQKGQKGETSNNIGEINELATKITKIETFCRSGQGMFTMLPNGFEYHISQNEMTYDNAKAYCDRIGSNLAQMGVRDGEMRRHLQAKILKGSTSIWIGLSDKAREGTFSWEDGTPLVSLESNWYDNEPNDAGSNEDCTTMRVGRGWKWNDFPCGLKYRALCERLSNSMCHLFV